MVNRDRFALANTTARRLRRGSEFLTPFDNIHGGIIAAVCDHVLGCVCYPHMERGQWAATTEFKLLTADAHILSMTRSTAVVRIEVTNDDRTACVAQGTVLIRDPRP